MKTEDVTIIKELLKEARYPVNRREYFVAMAMQGMLANPVHSHCDHKWLKGRTDDIADAMLAELTNNEKGLK